MTIWKTAGTTETPRRRLNAGGSVGAEPWRSWTYTSRLIGSDPHLTLHGGGNTSLKGSVRNAFGEDVPALYVKGSGSDLHSIEPSGFAVLDLARLGRLRQLSSLSDAEMTNQLRVNRLDANASPSVETLLHAFLPHTFVDHSHPEALLCLGNQPSGERLLAEAVGPGVVVLPYVAPGFPLAVAVARALEKRPDAIGVAVAKHGLFTFGEDARTVYEHHVAIVTACEKLLSSRPKRQLTPSYRTDTPPAELAARIAPVLRGVLAEKTGDEDDPYRRAILDWRVNDDVLAFVNSAEAECLAAALSRRTTSSGPVPSRCTCPPFPRIRSRIFALDSRRRSRSTAGAIVRS